VFAPEDVLWISAHSDLLGDSRLGPEQQQRFLPTRFNLQGQAVDSRGFVCQGLACPKCHLPVPRALLEMEAAFLSILGTPACGKSFYLTALTWELRRLLPLHFGLSFADADTVSNHTLHEYEESLFLNPRAEDLVPLADLIRKTELQGELYDTVMFGNQTVSYPRPLLFTVEPQAQHPSAAQARKRSRLLCLYDNAGEHFQPGQDSTSSPVTRHLTQARVLMFLFDPTQDLRFRQACPPAGGPTQVMNGKPSRQEAVLVEAAERIRRALGLPQGTRHNRPLIVVLTKHDVWADYFEGPRRSDPWREKGKLAGLDTERIDHASAELRKLLLTCCPEMVLAAENLAERVVYIAVSALGHSPVLDPRTQRAAIRPVDIQPSWVTVPFLYGVCRWLPGLIPAAKRSAERRAGQPDTPVPGRARSQIDWFAK
jgi:hypothetical protein